VEHRFGVERVKNRKGPETIRLQAGGEGLLLLSLDKGRLRLSEESIERQGARRDKSEKKKEGKGKYLTQLGDGLSWQLPRERGDRMQRYCPARGLTARYGKGGDGSQ